MAKPRVLVLTGYGINCEEETAFGFELAGAKAKVRHLNDVIDRPYEFDQFQILAFPGGFSYGDDIGSGNAYAHKLKNHLWEKLLKFVAKDKLVIGICNGFQILVNLGLLPAIDKNYGQRQAALIPNEGARYLVRWVDLEIKSQTPWLTKIKKISLPIAHGEGKFFAPPPTLARLQKKHLIAAKYCHGEICRYQKLQANPNGSLADIAAVTDETGRILGLMPHPERALFFTQLPHWSFLKEKYQREAVRLPPAGPGLVIFKNAVNYFN